MVKFILCLSVCLSACLYPINVKTAKPIGPKIFVGATRDPREGLRLIKCSKICLHQNSIFKNFENLRNFFYKIRELLFVFAFQVYTEKMFN